jgi:uncharacterized protein with GYD domain
MPTYILLGHYTEQGIQKVKDTVKRVDAVRALAKKVGATVKESYWTLGQYDVVAIIEAPDDAAMASLGLSIGALGNVRTQILRAFTAGEIGPIISRMG